MGRGRPAVAVSEPVEEIRLIQQIDEWLSATTLSGVTLPLSPRISPRSVPESNAKLRTGDTIVVF